MVLIEEYLAFKNQDSRRSSGSFRLRPSHDRNCLGVAHVDAVNRARIIDILFYIVSNAHTQSGRWSFKIRRKKWQRDIGSVLIVRS